MWKLNKSLMWVYSLIIIARLSIKYKQNHARLSIIFSASLHMASWLHCKVGISRSLKLSPRERC